MYAGHHLRTTLAFVLALVAIPVFAQGTENAIAAAVLFSAVAFGSVIAGLMVTVLYVLKRRSWQRVIVLVFGTVLLLTGLWIGSQPCGSSDMEFLQLLLSGIGVLILFLGLLLRPRRAGPREVHGQ